MRINHIKLRNYRKFRYSELEFGDGIISITGLNGAGKSSLVEAMAWVLYGNDKRILRDGKNGIRFSGAPPSDICSVEMDFEVAGDTYHIVREMRGKAGSMVAEIKQNGMVQASADRDVKKFIEQTLGMDAEGFLISVFARQKELNALSNLTDEARKKKIENMLGLDAIDRARKKMAEDRRDTKNTVEGMRGMLYDDDGTPVIEKKKEILEERRAQEKETSAQLKSLEKEHERTSEALKKAEEHLLSVRKKGENARALEARIERLKGYVAERKRAISEMEEELRALSHKKKRLSEMGDIPSELRRAEKELERMRAEREKLMRLKGLDERRASVLHEIEALRSQIQNYESDLEDMRSQIPDITSKKKRLAEIEQDITALESERNELVSEEKSLRKEYEKLHRSLKDIERLGPESRCPTCHRPLGIEHQSILEHMNEEKSDIEKKISELKERLRDAEERLKAMKSEKRGLEDEMKAIERMDQSIKNIEIKVETLKGSLDKYLSEEESVKKEIEAIGRVDFDEDSFKRLSEEVEALRAREKEYTELSTQIAREPELIERLNRYKGELKDFESDMESAVSELKGLDYSEKELQLAIEERDALLKKEKEIHGLIGILGERLSSLKRERESISEEIKELDGKMAVLFQKEEELRYLGALEGLMKSFRTEAIAGIKPALESVASQLFAEITEGKYAGIELDDNYEIKILDSGRAYPIKRFSGGESDLANLCLRLAISDVVVRAKGARGFNFLVLDEIFGSQDTGRRENIIGALQLLSNRFPQIFLISHIEGIKESASMVIRVQEIEPGGESAAIMED